MLRMLFCFLLLSFGAATARAQAPDGPIIVQAPCQMARVGGVAEVPEIDADGVRRGMAAVLIVRFNCDKTAIDVLETLGRNQMRPATATMLQLLARGTENSTIGDHLVIALGGGVMAGQNNPMLPVLMFVRINGENSFTALPRDIVYPAGTEFLVIWDRIS